MSLTFKLIIASLLAAALPVAACDSCGCDMTGGGGDGPPVILTGSAYTPARGQVILTFSDEYVWYKSLDPREAHHLHHQGIDVHSRIIDSTLTAAVSVGITPDFSLSLAVPHVTKRDYEVEDHDRLGESQTASGIGDVRLGAKYRFLRGEWQLAALANVKFATGRTTARTPGDELFEPELQPGSGATDFGAGLALTRHWPRLSFTADLSHTWRTEGAQDYRFGNLWKGGAGIAWRFNAADAPHPVSGSLEVSLLHALKDRQEGVIDEETGTRLAVFVAPGITVKLFTPVTAFLAFPIVVHDDPNGHHQKTRYEVISGIRMAF